METHLSVLMVQREKQEKRWAQNGALKVYSRPSVHTRGWLQGQI